MAQSVKKLFREAYEDKIYEAVDDYIREYPKRLISKFSRLHRIGYIKLDDIEIMAVYTELCLDNRLNFEIAVRATVVCYKGNFYYDDGREAYKWFSVMGTSSVEGLLDDFVITGVKIYSGKPRYRHALRDNFVPDIRKDNLDAIATDFLERYYPEALKEPVAIDTKSLLKRLGLKKIDTRISADSSVFGRIYFDEADTYFYDEGMDQPETVHISPGTILVDPMVFFMRSLGSLKNTIIHECVHWIFHRPAYVLEKNYNNSLVQLDCAVVGGLRGRKWSTASQIEWQANALTPRIQMPANTFKKKADELIVSLMEKRNTNSPLDVIEAVIERLADTFEVSRLSAKIRMVELGYEIARGAFVYVDGRYVRPYAYKRGYMKEHQTFSISLKDAIKLGMRDYELRENPCSMEYVYIDSHFVYNNPKYVKHTSNGIRMTKYALEHMDECCLVFDMSVSSGYDKDYPTECYLNREKNSPITFMLKYAGGMEKPGEIQLTPDQAEARDLEKAYQKLRTLPADYGEALKKLIDDSHMTIDDIADDSLVSAKTIRGMINGTLNRGGYENLANVCLSLQLHPVISEYLIEQSPWKCDFRNPRHQAIREALRHFYGHKMKDIISKINSIEKRLSVVPA